MGTGKRYLWLYLLIAGLLVYLAFPPTLLAQEAKVDLSLRIFPEYYYKEVIAGEDNALFMEVRNNGDKEIGTPSLSPVTISTPTFHIRIPRATRCYYRRYGNHQTGDPTTTQTKHLSSFAAPFHLYPILNDLVHDFFFRERDRQREPPCQLQCRARR